MAQQPELVRLRWISQRDYDHLMNWRPPTVTERSIELLRLRKRMKALKAKLAAA